VGATTAPTTVALGWYRSSLLLRPTASRWAGRLLPTQVLRLAGQPWRGVAAARSGLGEGTGHGEVGVLPQDLLTGPGQFVGGGLDGDYAVSLGSIALLVVVTERPLYLALQSLLPDIWAAAAGRKRPSTRRSARGVRDGRSPTQCRHWCFPCRGPQSSGQRTLAAAMSYRYRPRNQRSAAAWTADTAQFRELRILPLECPSRTQTRIKTPDLHLTPDLPTMRLRHLVRRLQPERRDRPGYPERNGRAGVGGRVSAQYRLPLPERGYLGCLRRQDPQACIGRRPGPSPGRDF
jgi:hypothetical protein